MEARPKQQKTKRTPRLYMKKLVLITINTVLKLISFIRLTTEYLSAPFKKMTRDEPKKNYKPKDSGQRTKSKKRNSIKRPRHWKEDTHVPWKITQKLAKLLLLLATPLLASAVALILAVALASAVVLAATAALPLAVVEHYREI